MNQGPHKYLDAIIAWAHGKQIQYLEDGTWCDYIRTTGATPAFGYYEWRVKPHVIKREGWVNVYRGNHSATVHQSKELAESCYGHGRIACIRIEWEEESND